MDAFYIETMLLLHWKRNTVVGHVIEVRGEESVCTPIALPTLLLKAIKRQWPAVGSRREGEKRGSIRVQGIEHIRTWDGSWGRKEDEMVNTGNQYPLDISQKALFLFQKENGRKLLICTAAACYYGKCVFPFSPVACMQRKHSTLSTNILLQESPLTHHPKMGARKKRGLAVPFGQFTIFKAWSL